MIMDIPHYSDIEFSNNKSMVEKKNREIWPFTRKSALKSGYFKSILIFLGRDLC